MARILGFKAFRKTGGSELQGFRLKKVQDMLDKA